MSKLQFRKELAAMDKEQLIELVLDAYSMRKEFREYFEFFINPDVNKLSEKYRQLIIRELDRVKRGGRSKARISVIKGLMKDFSSFQPGFEAEIDIRIFAIVYAMAAENRLWFTPTLEKGIAAVLCDVLDLADRNRVVDITVERLHQILTDTKAGSRYFRKFLSDAMELHLSDVANLRKKP